MSSELINNSASERSLTPQASSIIVVFDLPFSIMENSVDLRRVAYAIVASNVLLRDIELICVLPNAALAASK